VRVFDLTAEEEALLEKMDRERLTADERATRIVQFSRTKRRKKAVAAILLGLRRQANARNFLRVKRAEP
jgi:hypothetical protein